MLDLFFTAGHQGDTLASAWAVTDGKGEPIGPRMVLEVVYLATPNWGIWDVVAIRSTCLSQWEQAARFQLGRESPV